MHRLLKILAVVVFFPALSCFGQQPTVLHASLSIVYGAVGLSARISDMERTHTPAWVGYHIVTEQPFHFGTDPASIEYLEQPEHYGGYNRSYDSAADRVNLLMRIADGHIQQLRLASAARTLDAGGLQFVWLTDVPQEDSIHLLEADGQNGSSQQVRETAVFLISLHRSPLATAALLKLASNTIFPDLQEKAAFWLASSRGHEGFLAIQTLLQQAPEAAFRAKLSFNLTLCHEPAATDQLIELAQHDSSPQVRSQAQFWMANLASKEIAGTLRADAEHDPDEQVRNSAVFALSQLPGDQAATELIQVAQTNRDPQLRQQAIFWLGQSRDPRAFEYLVQTLRTHPQKTP